MAHWKTSFRKTQARGGGSSSLVSEALSCCLCASEGCWADTRGCLDFFHFDPDSEKINYIFRCAGERWCARLLTQQRCAVSDL